MRAVIASGAGRYADPWHPYPATSCLLAGILDEIGFRVRVEPDVDVAMTHLDGADLLVVNAGDPWRSDGEPSPQTPAESVRGFDRAVERGIGVLGLHAAVASLRDYPGWAPAIGAMWIPGLSWHPPAGPMRVHIADDAQLDGLSDFDVVDERYVRLQPIGRSSVVAAFEHDGGRHPAAWVREHGRARIAADVLGHDGQSYSSDGHRRLVQGLARWAARA